MKKNDRSSENLFNGLRNYSSCASCISLAFEVSQQHLSHQHKKEKRMYMISSCGNGKKGGGKQYLGAHVLMPDEGDRFFHVLDEMY